MCGRSRCAASHGAVAQALGVPQANWKDADKYRPTHNCCPGKYTPVLYTGENGERKVRVVRGEAWRKCSLPVHVDPHAHRAVVPDSQHAVGSGAFLHQEGRQARLLAHVQRSVRAHTPSANGVVGGMAWGRSCAHALCFAGVSPSLFVLRSAA